MDLTILLLELLRKWILFCISREIVQKSHKFIILKGKNAQEELKNSSQAKKIKYRIVNSVTDKDSKLS